MTMSTLCYILIIVGIKELFFRSSQQHQTKGTEYSHVQRKPSTFEPYMTEMRLLPLSLQSGDPHAKLELDNELI